MELFRVKIDFTFSVIDPGQLDSFGRKKQCYHHLKGHATGRLFHHIGCLAHWPSLSQAQLPL